MTERIKQFAAAAITAAKNATRTNYFASSKKDICENFELKAELNSDRSTRKEAVKKVIANMTVGKDVSSLFADVLKCMQTDDLELKKLVYLYLINYAKTQPEVVILAVNTFCKDTEDPNPLIRALAIRTMGCIRVDKILDYILEPLRKCLKDEHPYVRKTAAICVAKLFDLNPELAQENGLLTMLQNMLTDSNPMVISNAIAALAEIQQDYPESKALDMNHRIVSKLLTALNECTEWGQIFILDALSDYEPTNAEEAENIFDKVVPRLQHSNGSVVLSAVKLLVLLIQRLPDQDARKKASKKLAQPLISLLSSIPEVQYSALKNIGLIVQANPDILDSQVKIFFCKYNDPLYVKIEKLKIIVLLVNSQNVDQVLLELKEYCTEIDVEFVRMAIRTIGKCAFKLESALEKSVEILCQLFQTKIDYVVQEAGIVATNIIRRYPNQFMNMIPSFFENIGSFAEPPVKASLVWIAGEYYDRIGHYRDYIIAIAAGFKEESPIVQQQLLTAAIKICLKGDQKSLDWCKEIIDFAASSENPDLRDRGVFYSRMLQSYPAEASKVVLSSKKFPIKDEIDSLDQKLLATLIRLIGTVSSIHYVPPTFVPSRHVLTAASFNSTLGSASHTSSPQNIPAVADLLDLGFDSIGSPSATPPPIKQTSSNVSPVVDLLTDDIFSLDTHAYSPIDEETKQNLNLLLDADAGDGLEIKGKIYLSNNLFHAVMQFTNKTKEPISDFAIQFNKNSFGFCPDEFKLNLVQANSREFVKFDLVVHEKMQQQMEPLNVLQIAIKASNGVHYMQISIPYQDLIDSQYDPTQEEFSSLWNQPGLPICSKSFDLPLAFEDLDSFLEPKGYKIVGQSSQTLEIYIKFINGIVVVAELQNNISEVFCIAKSTLPSYPDFVMESLDVCLNK